MANLKWHVLDGSKATGQPGGSHMDHMRMAVTGTVAQTEGRLVGFFSKTHHGVFTHMGSNSHLHAVLAKEGVSGHVDGVTLKKGAVLLLPQ
jgi:acetolactate decarboxylase